MTINAVNDAPVNTVPVGQTVDEDTNLVFSAANGNLVSRADLDVDETAAPNNTVQVALAVGHGTLTLSRVTGLTFTSGKNNSAAMTFRGNLSNVNAALDGMIYRGEADYSGSDSLSMTTSDLGNTGFGRILVDSDECRHHRDQLQRSAGAGERREHAGLHGEPGRHAHLHDHYPDRHRRRDHGVGAGTDQR